MKRLYKSGLGAVTLRGCLAIAIFALLLLIFEAAARLFAEVLWFQEVDYLSIFLIRRQSQLVLWLLATCISGTFLGGNLWLADRWQWRWLPKSAWHDRGTPYTPSQKQLVLEELKPLAWGKKLPIQPEQNRQTYSPRLKLPLLLVAAITFAVAIACIILNYSSVALAVWQTSYRLPQIASTLKPPLDIFNLANLAGFLLSYLRQLGLVLAVALLLLWQPQISLKAIATLLGIIFGLIAAGNWTVFLRFF